MKLEDFIFIFRFVCPFVRPSGCPSVLCEFQLYRTLIVCQYNTHTRPSPLLLQH